MEMPSPCPAELSAKRLVCAIHPWGQAESGATVTVSMVLSHLDGIFWELVCAGHLHTTTLLLVRGFFWAPFSLWPHSPHLSKGEAVVGMKAIHPSSFPGPTQESINSESGRVSQTGIYILG